MALVEDTTVRYMINSTTENFTFHLSKTLNELTADDIKSQDAFTGFTSFGHNQLKEGVLSQGAPINNPNHSWFWCTDPSYFSDVNTVCHWSTPPNFPDGVYMRTILVFRPLNVGANSSLTKARNNVRIVIDITPDSGTSMQNLAFDNPYVSCRYNNNQNGENRVTDYNYISPAVIIEVNNTLYLWVYGGLNWFSVYANSVLDQGYIDGYTNYNNESSYHRLAMGWTIGGVDGAPFLQGFTNNQIENYDLNGHSCTFGVNIGASNYHWRISEMLTDNANKTITKMYLAFSGLKFSIDGTWYKPIIEGGIVTGYTDDFTKKSEWDNWTKATGHNVPSGGGGGGGGGDDAEAETFGWGGNEVGGMVHYYLLTQSEMESLAGFMSNPNWTIDYRNCIVSMFIIPNNGTVVFDDDTFEPTTVKFRLDENNKVDTGISCNRIHNVVNNHGTIEIPRMNNNFLDYEPYSKYYVYVPFCGVTSLPDYIAGKEIKVTIYPDVPTCSCTAVISSESRKIATLRGNFGSSIPVTSDGSGLKTAAVINSMANGLVGLGEMAAGAGLDNPGLVIGGGMTAISSILQTALTFGQAFGYSVGSSGDTSFFGIGNRCEYYIAYPQWNNPDGEDTNIYGHTYGFVVNKRGIIGDFEGFTVCDNPHVTGFSCTSDEKDEIERLLREGIIIHKPSE